MDTSFLSFMIYIFSVLANCGLHYSIEIGGNCLHVLSTVQLNMAPWIFLCPAESRTLAFSMQLNTDYTSEGNPIGEERNDWVVLKQTCDMIQNIKQSKITWCENDIKCGFYFVVLIANKSFQEVHISGCKFKNCGFICLVWHSRDKFP